MTKKKQQEIDNMVADLKEYTLAYKLAYLDMLQSINDLIEVCSTDEVLNLNTPEPEEEIKPQTLEETQEVINDIILEKGDKI